MKKAALILSLFLFAAVSLGAVSSFYLVDDTTGMRIPFGTGGELHFENLSGLPNNVTIISIEGDIASHINNTSIHFTEDSINHENIQNVGLYNHTTLDNHVDDSTIHFQESSINHENIQNVGLYNHTTLDNHVDDTSIHFTQSSIIHDNLDGASGYYNHSTINAHIDDETIHAPIYDNLSTSTSFLWSSDYTKDYVDTHSGGSASISYCKVSDTKTSGTDGGSCIAGEFRVRDFTVEDSDDDSFCNITGNQIVLDSGTYITFIRAPAFVVNNHKAILYNVSGSTTLLIGSTAYAPYSYNAHTDSIISGQFSLLSQSNLEVRHRCNGTRTTDGFGRASSFGVSEVYTTAEFWRIGE